MYSSLLSPQDLARLSDVADFPSLVAQLKHSAYAPYLENLKDKDITPRRVLLQIKNRLADSYNSVIHMAPEHTRPLLTQLYRYFEVGNLKAVLRGIVTGTSSETNLSLWDRVREVLFPFGPMTVMPAQAMIETGSVVSALELIAWDKI